MNFSQKLVFAYTCIVVVPLCLVVASVIGLVRKSRTEELVAGCDALVRENAAAVAKHAEVFNRFEQLVHSDGPLTLLVAMPERTGRGELIETVIAETTQLERTLETVPDIYALRVFSDSPLVPERWPVFLHSGRTDLASLERWEFGYLADYLGNQDAMQQESVCTTRRLEKNRRPIGYVQIAMRTADFFPFLYRDATRYNDDYVFREARSPETGLPCLLPVTNAQIDARQAPLSPRQQETLCESLYPSGGGRASSGRVVLREKRDVRYASWVRMADPDLVLLHTVSAGSLARELFLVQGGILVALAFTAALLYVLVRSLTARLMARVYALIGGMQQVQGGNLAAAVAVTGHDEVTEAQRTFNDMTARLQSQIAQIQKEQQLIADTELKAMQNQINAHFLYNALETIKMQAVIAGAPDVEESIGILGRLMRYCLRWRVHEVTLEQEVDYIRSYVALLNLRNDYVISLETEIPAAYEGVVVAKMSLQPVVENAFFYAVEPLGTDAVIRVYTEEAAEPGRLWLCVRDFGPGIPAEKLAELRAYLADGSDERDSRGSIGLKNIQQRLTAFYGPEFHLVIESAAGEGTLVKIPVPTAGREDRR